MYNFQCIIQNKFRDWPKENYISWICLHQYTPELVQMELFFCQLGKSIITSKGKVINLEKKSDRIVIINLVVSIDNVTIIRIWSHFILRLKQLVGELCVIFDQNL